MVIRENVPSGTALQKKPHWFGADFDLAELLCAERINVDRTARSLGTLGGGNHFIELDQDEDGNLYVVIHSGSRHLGTAVMEYYLTTGRQHMQGGGRSRCGHWRLTTPRQQAVGAFVDSDKPDVKIIY